MIRLLIFPLVLLAGTALQAQSVPIEGPRDPAQFAALFAKSPFVMPSGGDQSPLSQRYAITGIASMNGEPIVFLLDQATKQRLAISARESQGGVTFVSLTQNDDPNLVRATIRSGSETGDVGFAKSQLSPARNAAAPANTTAATPAPPPATPAASPAAELVAAPQPQPSAPSSTRRIIRRTTALPAPGAAINNQ